MLSSMLNLVTLIKIIVGLVLGSCQLVSARISPSWARASWYRLVLAPRGLVPAGIGSY